MQTEDNNQSVDFEDETFATREQNDFDDIGEMDDAFMDGNDGFVEEDFLDDMPRQNYRSKKATPELRRSIEDLLEEKRLQEKLSDVFEDELEYM